MIHSKRSIPIIIAVVIVAAASLLFSSIGRAGKSIAQDAEKSLDIERYPNEPLELVDIKVSGQSVKSKIKFKSKDNISGWGRDNVKFRDKDDWFKNIRIRLRNVSGRPIYGLRAELRLEHPDPSQRLLFSLPLTWTKILKREPLQPNDEIDLEVSDQLLDRALERMRRYGADVKLSPVSFSVDDAYFSDDLKWSRGVLLRRDPNNRYKWDLVDKAAPNGDTQLFQPIGFKPVSFKPIAYRAQVGLSRCQAAYGGEVDPYCNGDYESCARIEQLGNGAAGNMSTFSEVGDCEQEGVISCMTETTHKILQYDPSCPPPPAPTPTPAPTPVPTPEPTPRHQFADDRVIIVIFRENTGVAMDIAAPSPLPLAYPL